MCGCGGKGDRGGPGASGRVSRVARSRAVRSAAALGLSAAAVPGVMAVAFDIARRTWARRSQGPAGTVVILGCALRGTEPSTLLRLRLEKGAEVARRAVRPASPPAADQATSTVPGQATPAVPGKPTTAAPGHTAPAVPGKPTTAAPGHGTAADPDPAPASATVIACGGTGDDEIIAEATVMARWLHARGIPGVVEESESTSTIENLRNAAPLVPKAPVIVVTSDFHVFRTRWLTRRHGLAGWTVEGAPTPARYWSTSMLREFLALGTMWPLPGIALGAGFAAWGLATTD